MSTPIIVALLAAAASFAGSYIGARLRVQSFKAEKLVERKIELVTKAVTVLLHGNRLLAELQDALNQGDKDACDKVTEQIISLGDELDQIQDAATVFFSPRGREVFKRLDRIGEAFEVKVNDGTLSTWEAIGRELTQIRIAIDEAASQLPKEIP